MRSRWHLAWSVVFPLSALALQWLLWDWISPFAWLLFTPGVFISALLTGLRGGILATLISIFAVWYFFLTPRFSFQLQTPSEAISMLVFATVGVAFSVFSEQVRAMRARLAAVTTQGQLREVLDAVADAVFIATRDGRYTYVNPRATELLGYSAAELLTMNIADITPPSEVALTAATRARLEAHDRMCVELQLKHKNGYLVTVELNGVMLPDGELFASCRDISARKREEEALRKSEAQLHTFVACAPLSIAMLDRDMNYLAVSDRWRIQYGNGREDLTGLNHYNLHPDMPVFWRDAHTRALAGATTTCDEDLWQRGDGSKTWLKWAVLPWTNDKGAVGGVIVSTEDMTERKRQSAELARYRDYLEQRVVERTAELQVASARLIDTDFALERVGIGIHWVDAENGRFHFVNTFAAEMLGYTVDEMIQLSVPDIDPNFALATFAATTEALREQPHVQFESQNRTRDGRLIPVEVTLQYMPARADEPARFIAFVTDITARKAAERKLLAAHDAALASLRHDIRGPLDTILAQLAELRSGDLAPAHARQFESIAHASAQAVARLERAESAGESPH